MNSAKKIIGPSEQLFDVADYEWCKKKQQAYVKMTDIQPVTYNNCDNKCKIGCDFRRI